MERPCTTTQDAEPQNMPFVRNIVDATNPAVVVCHPPSGSSPISSRIGSTERNRTAARQPTGQRSGADLPIFNRYTRKEFFSSSMGPLYSWSRLRGPQAARALGQTKSTDHTFRSATEVT